MKFCLSLAISAMLGLPVVFALAQGSNSGDQRDLPSAPSATIEQRRPAPPPPPPPPPPPAPKPVPAEPERPEPSAESVAEPPPSPEPAPNSERPPTGGSAMPSVSAAGAADISDDEPLATIRKTVDEVNLVFTVTDKRGRFVKDLTKDDFQILDDKKAPASIVNFRSETDLPLRVGLLVDASNSIRDRFQFEQDAAVEFLNHSVRPRFDRAFVLGFDTNYEVVQDFTDRAELLANGVHRLRPGGGTALYDALFYACRDKLMNTPETGPVRRAIVLLSDGEDNQSRVTREEAIDMAQRAEVVVYAISTNISGVRLKGDRELQRIVEATGGRAFFPFKIEDVGTAFAEVQDELRSQYAIAYRPAEFAGDGRFRSIEIKAAQKDLRVRARKGYYAPQE